jgi:hypothetical protein
LLTPGACAQSPTRRLATIADIALVGVVDALAPIVNARRDGVRDYPPKIQETILRRTDFPLPPPPWTKRSACSRVEPVRL